MDTDVKNKKSIPKVRTFAHDLEVNRGTGKASTNPVQTPTTGIIVGDNNSVVKPSHHDGETIIKNTDYQKSTNENTKSNSENSLPIQKYSSLTQATQKAVSKVTGQKNVRDESYEATIITDSKHKRFYFTTEVATALHKWWKRKVTDYTESKKPKYTIPQAERRKGVIQKAISTTGRTINTDHADVLALIKANKIAIVDKHDTMAEHSIMDRSTKDSKEVIWSTTEENKKIIFPTVSKAEPVLTTITEPKVPIIPLPPFNKEKNKPIIKEVPQPEINQPKNTEVEKTSLTKSEGLEKLPSELDDDNIIDSSDEVLSEEYFDESPDQIENKSSILSRLFILLRSFQPIKNPNRVVIYTLVVVTIGLAMYLVVNKLTTSSTNAIVVVNNYTPTIFNPSTQYHEVIAETEKKKIFAQLQEKNNPEESITELVFLSPIDGREVTGSTLLPLLGFDLAPDFVSSLEHIAFGFYHNEPWIVINTNNKTTAQGGLLQWELNMSNDLDPLFGPTVRSSKIISSLTAFGDSSINTIDVRILFGDDGQEHIVYGFISPNQILITTNTTTWLNLSNDFKQP